MKTGTVLLAGAAAYGVWYISNLGTATQTINIVFKTVKINSPTSYTIVLTVQKCN